MEMKKKDIERLVEKDGQLWSTFKESVSDSKFADFLTKVFKKKMKRPLLANIGLESSKDYSANSE